MEFCCENSARPAGIVGSIQALTTVGTEALSPIRSATMADLTNDNELPSAASRFDVPDARGQAAILLVESLIHALIARSLIRLEDAIDVVTTAIDVKMEIAAGDGDSDDSTDHALGLLVAIRHSLRHDIR